jgi:4-hydroxybenzoate polyprenyltransferase
MSPSALCDFSHFPIHVYGFLQHQHHTHLLHLTNTINENDMQQMQNLPKIPVPAESVLVANTTQQEMTAYKSLGLFYVAANALLLAGQLLNPVWNWEQFLLLQWCGFTGVFMIYRFNDIIDHSENFRFNLGRVLSSRVHVWCLLQFFFFTIPAILFLLSDLRIVLLFSTCFLGLLYSVNVRIRSKNYRIKHLFLVKNGLIGTLWGGMILIGANALAGELVMALFVFTSLQVMTGSIIRDLPDTEADRKDGVQTLPVVLGISRSIIAIHLLNLVSLAAGWLLFPNGNFLLLMLLVVGWRAFTVVKLARNPKDALYSNTFNLLTCFLIFMILFIQHNNGLYPTH